MADTVGNKKMLFYAGNCPFCKNKADGNLGDHIKNVHGEQSYKSAVIWAKEAEIPDQKIGEIFNIGFKQMERIITESYGINISALTKTKKVKHWLPKDYQEETTTVWSFKQRGDWATHDGRYRGNWSPYIPRNVILKYSRPGDIVLDYFAGGGTTAIEAKLLGRRCIARDINPAAIALNRENLKFSPPLELFDGHQLFEPEVSVGDARKLEGIDNDSVDLICSHPPYAGIISYGSNIEGDLSRLGYDEFISEISSVARESYRVLKPGAKCAILIGDTRAKKHIVPIGFRTISTFLDAGFRLKELIIKRQHNCKTTGFWYSNSIKHNFLLLAHEYLAVFEKPPALHKNTQADIQERLSIYQGKRRLFTESQQELETTSVWILPDKDSEEYLDRNIVKRYSDSTDYWQTVFDYDKKEKELKQVDENTGLVLIKSPCLDNVQSLQTIQAYEKEVIRFIRDNVVHIKKGGFVVIQTRDIRINGYVEPLAKRFVEKLSIEGMWLKEIIIITRNGDNSKQPLLPNGNLDITHQYLLVYEVSGDIQAV